MAFEVILLHRMSWKGYDGPFFAFLKACELFSVPVFMIIAFYLSASMIESENQEKLRNRFIRLITPQIGWAIICWLVYAATDIIFAHHLSHSFSDLFWAIVSGCRQNTNPSTWFQCVLILLTFFYTLVFHFFDKRTGWIIVHLSVVFAFLVQYNGLYYAFFEDKSYELMNTIGRIFEIMPFAGLGMILKRIDVFGRMKGKRIVILAVAAFLFVIGFFLTFPKCNGFFAGIYPAYMAVMLFLFFLFLPLENVSFKMRRVIYHISRFTLGIYCAHRLVYSILDILYELAGIEPGSFMKCILVYLACYVMSLIVSLIPNKILKNMVE